MSQGIDTFDAAVEDFFARLRGHPAADRLFYLASDLGDHSLVWLAIGVLRAAVSRHDTRRRRAALRLLAALTFESALVNGAVKSVFRRRRPALAGEHPHHLRQPRTSSFPSGHASSAACALVLLADGDAAWPLYALVAAVVAASRLHVRIHHGSDVVGGIAIGALVGLMARRLFPLGGLPAPGEPVDGYIR